MASSGQISVIPCCGENKAYDFSEKKETFIWPVNIKDFLVEL